MVSERGLAQTLKVLKTAVVVLGVLWVQDGGFCRSLGELKSISLAEPCWKGGPKRVRVP